MLDIISSYDSLLFFFASSLISILFLSASIYIFLDMNRESKLHRAYMNEKYRQQGWENVIERTMT